MPRVAPYAAEAPSEPADRDRDRAEDRSGAAARRVSTLSDAALFEGVQRGSEAHFRELYERYFHRIYNFIHLRVRNRADAEELTQETFTVVFRSIESFSGRSSPLGWIYGIAKNTTYGHLRRQRLQGARLEEAGPTALLTDSATWSCDPEQRLALDRCAKDLAERLRSVSSWQAEAFYLRHVENLSIREICRLTERSSDAIRSGLYRVKRLLVEEARPDTASLGA